MSDAILSIIAGVLAADFLSGFFHWLEDGYGSTDWPIVGKYIIAPNRLHHTNQIAFLAGSYLHRNWTTIVPAMLAFVAMSLAFGVSLFSLTLFFAVSQANEVHAWAHQKCSWPIEVLQSAGLLCSPRQHSEHHRGGHDRRYCTITNLLNPFLDALYFWRTLEAVLRVVGISKVKEVAS